MSTSPATIVAGEGVAAAPRPRAGGRRPQPPRHFSKQSRFAPLWLLSPAGIVILALIVAPIVFLVYTSFTDFNQRTLFTGEYHGVGVEQYTRIFTDPQFWASTGLTLVFTVALVGGSLIIGVGVSQLMTKLGTAMRYIVTIVLIFAWGMPNVASAQVWNWLFQPGYGVINWLLAQLHVFGDTTDLSWWNSTPLALFNIWMLVVWQAVPFIALTTYAAQTQIDGSLIEAARIDGAGEWRIYFSVVLNSLKPTLLLITVLSIIWDFNVFNQIWLTTQGGPDNGTATLGIWAYLTAFNQFKIGTGAAIAVVTTVMLMIISGFYIRSLLRSGEDL
ncbi:carbohydrate ABC transporter permease [Microbacterium luticocti]|uniref:carbohydrate ABC transporter permease n=1 Tax=Microbacterium luticocti TaxID=451764 RepID=UPI000409B9DB|nr:sugar ABC transporter permease [Microbacterium luticocti]